MSPDEIQGGSDPKAPDQGKADRFSGVRRILFLVFVGNVLLFVIINVFLVIIWLLAGRGYPWFLWIALSWGLLLVLHGVFTASYAYITLGMTIGDTVVKEEEKAPGLEPRAAVETSNSLEIKMLGPFELRKGGDRIPVEDWKSKKALSVLKYMAANRTKGLVPRDVLMELLWPEADPRQASKNLNTTLSVLRKSLEPKAARGKSSYLKTSGDSLQLELGDGGWIDFEVFLMKLDEAREAEQSGDMDSYLKALEEAESIYTGDFLSEGLYEDWCQLERSRLKEKHTDLLVSISNVHLEMGRSEEALRYLESAITADPGREDLYRDQMDVYSGLGNRAGIERTFERCRDYLEENFDVSPSPETVELYQRLREE